MGKFYTIFAIICESFLQVTLEAHFINDLGMDSLDAVEVVMAFEDEFGKNAHEVESKWCDYVHTHTHTHCRL